MTTKSSIKVYSVSISLQALMVQDMLERAGIPTLIRRSTSGFDMLVPAALAGEAKALLATAS